MSTPKKPISKREAIDATCSEFLAALALTSIVIPLGLMLAGIQ